MLSNYGIGVPLRENHFWYTQGLLKWEQECSFMFITIWFGRLKSKGIFYDLKDYNILTITGKPCLKLATIVKLHYNCILKACQSPIAAVYS